MNPQSLDDQFSTAPIPYRSYLKQQAQDSLKELPANLQEPVDVNNIQPLTQAPPPPAHPAIVTATSQAVQSGANPLQLAMARANLPGADYIGYCEKFVENAQGKNGVYPSAIAAWNAQQK